MANFSQQRSRHFMPQPRLPKIIPGPWSQGRNQHDVVLYEFWVEFSDPEESMPIKISWLEQHRALGAQWLFNGIKLLSATPYPLRQPFIFSSLKSDNISTVEIKISLPVSETGEPVSRVRRVRKHQLPATFFWPALAPKSIVELVTSRPPKPLSIKFIQPSDDYPPEPDVDNFAPEFHQYRVDFPDKTSEDVSVKCTWLKQHYKTIGIRWLFNGTILLSTLRFALKPLVLTSVKNDGTTNVELKITYENTFNKLQYHALLWFNFIRIRMRKLLHEGVFPMDKRIMQQTFGIWQGYNTTITFRNDFFLLNCEFVKQAMVVNVLELLNKQGPEEFELTVLNATITTFYDKKTYRVENIDWGKNPLSAFTQDGKTTTFVKYFEYKYRIKILHVGQPLLICRPCDEGVQNGPVVELIVPELCRLTRVNDQMFSSFNLVQSMGEAVFIADDAWFARLDKYNSAHHRVEFIPETLVYGTIRNKTHNTIVEKTDLLPDWFVVTSVHQESHTDRFISAVQKMSLKLKLMIPEPTVFLQARSGSGYELEQSVENIVQQHDPGVILISVAETDCERYKNLRKSWHKQHGIHFLIISGSNIKSSDMEKSAAKAAIQICEKLGGLPWTVNFPRRGAMIVGVNASRIIGPGIKPCGALVATSDAAMRSFYNSTTHHVDGERMQQTLGYQMVSAVQRWHKLNGSVPARVIVYRAGVGDGEIKHTCDLEADAIEKELIMTYGPEAPKLTYIIITKTTGTSLDSMKGNQPEGPAVETVSSFRQEYDFFLTSARSEKGKVVVIYYTIIRDKSGWGPSQNYRLTYILSNLSSDALLKNLNAKFLEHEGVGPMPAVVITARYLALQGSVEK